MVPGVRKLEPSQPRLGVLMCLQLRNPRAQRSSRTSRGSVRNWPPPCLDGCDFSSAGFQFMFGRRPFWTACPGLRFLASGFSSRLATRSAWTVHSGGSWLASVWLHWLDFPECGGANFRNPWSRKFLQISALRGFRKPEPPQPRLDV